MQETWVREEYSREHDNRNDRKEFKRSGGHEQQGKGRDKGKHGD